MYNLVYVVCIEISLPCESLGFSYSLVAKKLFLATLLVRLSHTVYRLNATCHAYTKLNCL